MRILDRTRHKSHIFILTSVLISANQWRCANIPQSSDLDALYRTETETEQHYLDSPSVRVRRDRIHGLQNTLLRLQSQCVLFTFATPPRPSNKTHTHKHIHVCIEHIYPYICPYMYIVHVYTGTRYLNACAALLCCGCVHKCH